MFVYFPFQHWHKDIVKNVANIVRTAQFSTKNQGHPNQSERYIAAPCKYLSLELYLNFELEGYHY